MRIQRHEPLNPAYSPRRRAVALAGLLVACVPLACSGDDSGTTDTQGDTSTTSGSSSSTDTTTSASDSTTTTSDSTTTTGSTDATSTTHDHGTTHETTEASSTTHDHGTTHDTHDTDATTGGDDAEAYCACMLANCHEFYHGTWGEDHEIAEQMCIAAAEALDADHFACRLEHCEASAQDESLCAAAIGGGECM